jgi:ketosteroid isomerase-like protein
MIKELTITISLLLIFFSTYSQNAAETEIRKLEEEARIAFLNKDTTTLLKLYSPKLVVNSPLNKVSTFEQIMGRIRKGEDDRGSFERTIENITFANNIAIVMGGERLIPTENAPNAGKTVKRRFTNIWMEDKGRWQLVARQATIISVE